MMARRAAVLQRKHLAGGQIRGSSQPLKAKKKKDQHSRQNVCGPGGEGIKAEGGSPFAISRTPPAGVGAGDHDNAGPDRVEQADRAVTGPKNCSTASVMRVEAGPPPRQPP